MLLINVSEKIKIDDVNVDILEEIAEKILSDFDKKDLEVNLYFCSDEEIHILNRDYREKDYPTDVLSFPLYDGVDNLLGEIIISIDTARRQKEKDDVNYEIRKLFIHGMIHLMGYDHETDEEYEIMHPIEEKYLKLYEQK